MLGRSKDVTTLNGSVMRSTWVMSSRTAGVAVAVTASTGAAMIERRLWMRRKAGRNSWPHSEMQCASSMVISETGVALSRVRSLAASRRSGEQKSKSRAPPAMSASVRRWDGFGSCEVSEAARRPSFRARST